MSNTRHRFLCAALALAMLFALHTPAVANAGAPTVTASENPVLIAYPHFTTKDITLSWNSAGGGASLIVKEDGGLVHNELVNGDGSTPFTVTYGKTYTAYLAVPIVGIPLSETLTITTDKPELHPGCALKCITSVEVQPHGGWAQFAIRTNTMAVITLEASPTPPSANDTWSNPADVTAFNGTVLPTKNWSPPLANLSPNTTYHYVVRAREHGHESVKTGTFKTMTRRVDVNFADIQMIDDSDGPFDGDCDCWFWFGVGDELPKQWGDSTNKISIASGTTVHPNVHVTLMDAPTDVRLGAMGHDDDDDPIEFCSYGVGPPVEGHPVDWEAHGNSDLCLEYAGGQVTAPLSRQGPPGSPGDVDEQFTDSFTIKVNAELAFNVRGTYKVTYVP
jgi:hypothetical protein